MEVIMENELHSRPFALRLAEETIALQRALADTERLPDAVAPRRAPALTLVRRLASARHAPRTEPASSRPSCASGSP
jgi:hypothetical protein